MCVNQLVCAGSDTLFEVWSRILWQFLKRELMRIKEEISWEKVVYLIYPAVQYVWRLAVGFLYCKQQLPYCGSWLLGDQNMAGGFSTEADKISFSSHRPCGKEFLKCEIFGCTDSRTRQEVFFWNKISLTPFSWPSERTPQMSSLWMLRYQNKTGGCYGQLVEPPKRKPFFLQILKQCSVCVKFVAPCICADSDKVEYVCAECRTAQEPPPAALREVACLRSHI